MNILNKLNTLKAAQNKPTREGMTPETITKVKAHIIASNLGYNVHPNQFDIATPYRVAINFDNKWHNFGYFADQNVAAAVGTIVSVAFFGENARAGTYDQAVVEASAEYQEWISSPKSAETIARANGDLPSIMAEKLTDSKAATTNVLQQF